MSIKYQKPIDGPITSKWSEPRPLSNPGEHPHGAIDISGNVNQPIHAMEDGFCYFFKLTRHDRQEKWTEDLDVGKKLPWSYAYDLYGGVIVLFDKHKYVHLITHCYFRGIFESGVVPKSYWVYDEESTDERFPMELMHTFTHPLPVVKGQIIGKVGNAGYSTAPHVHWEMHRGWNNTVYEDRPNPETFL